MRRTRRGVDKSARESDAATTRWIRIVFWAFLLACAAVLLYQLGAALWRIFGRIYRTYTTEAALIWPFR
jgi:hypothetical protein